MIAHETALDLAADRLDFGLSDGEVAQLEDHLRWCRTCREFDGALRLDDDLLESMRWLDDDTGHGGYDEDAIYEPPDDADDDAPDDAPDRSTETADDRGPAAPSDPDADDRDDGPAGATDDADAPEGSTETADDGADAEPADPAADDAADDDADDDAADDESDEDLAGGLDDGTLAALEQQTKDVFPACAADAVEDAARQNGVDRRAQDRRAAEEAVRAAEDLEHTEYGSVAVCRSIRGVVRGPALDDLEASSAAAAAVRNAILRSRTGHTGVDRYQNSGRLDGRGLFRIAMNDSRLFSRRRSPDPGKYLVWVMVDCSVSMRGLEVRDAAIVARALADASAGTPSVRLAVWAWSDPFLPAQRRVAHAGVAKVWETGAPTSEVFKLTQLSMGGTPDAAVMEWAWRAIQREARADERPVLILASDGFGDRRLSAVVARARKRGVLVKSVALGGAVDEARQEATFGRDNYVAWRGSIAETARPLATMVGRMAAGL